MSFHINALTEDFKQIVKKWGFTLSYFNFNWDNDEEECVEAVIKSRDISFGLRVENPNFVCAGEIEFISDKFSFIDDDRCFEILIKEFQRADKFVKYLSREFSIDDYRISDY